MRALLLLLVLVGVQPAAAQNLLPGHFSGWQTVSGSRANVALDQLPAAQATVLRDCHGQTAERRIYERGSAKIEVTLYSMANPSWAYSAFSVLRPVPATDFRPTPHAAIGRQSAMMLVGNLLVDIEGQNLPSYSKDFELLAKALEPHASREPYPTLWQYLPRKGLVPHSDRYALDPRTLNGALAESGSQSWPTGDWLGFGDEAEAEVGRYEIAGRPTTLLLASYPTQQLAAEHVKDLARWFAVDPATGERNELPALYTRRVGSLVALVFEADSHAQANLLLRQIQDQTVVTWNEPASKFHERAMPYYLIGIIFGTFTILLITLVAGIALGMIRVGIKHAFPGLIFDRRRSIEIIQLGLTSKPIDPSDLY